MASIYLWPDAASPTGHSILIRMKYGGGIARAVECCCRCNCDQLPDTLYAKIEHTVNTDGGGSTTRTTYFELTSPPDDDGCSCTPVVDTGVDKKAWHGIFSRSVWTFVVDHYELRDCDVHMVLNCNSEGVEEVILLAVGITYYDCITNTPSITCDDSGSMNVDCPIEWPIHLDPEVGGITDMWLLNAPWS